jgi:cytochrome c peroxidase
MRVRVFPALVSASLLPAVACGPWADDLSCAPQGCGWSQGEWGRITSLADRPVGGGPGLGPLPTDPSNAWADDPAAARLGQAFFFDAAFSGLSRQLDALKRPTTLGRAPVDQPSGVSCATCHDLLRGGTDVTSSPGHVSVGAGLTDVNALPVVNAARRRTLFWNGRMESLWGLNALVGESDTTMNGSRLQTAHALASSTYGDRVQTVFGRALPGDWRARVARWPARGKPGRGDGCQAGDAREPYQDAFECLSPMDQELATRLLVLWAKALAAYGRLLESRDSAFDRFVAEGPRSGAIDARARRGARLFVGKAGCIDCHGGPLLTDERFHNIGVPQTGVGVPTVAECVVGSPCDCVGGAGCLPWGRLWGLQWQRDPAVVWLDLVQDYRDDAGAPPPAATGELDRRLLGAWRTPSLRDVALTAPYMHDGAYRSIEEVLWHYNTAGRGVSAGAVGVPAVQLKPLGLSEDELGDLAAFLKTLTGAPVPDALRDPRPAP